VGKMVFNLMKTNSPDFDKLSMVYETVKTFQFPRPSEAYSFLFKAFHKAFKDSNQYIEFADWTTKLSAVFPPYKPPQLRLKLNEQLKNEKLLPLEIKRTTRSKSGTQEIVSKLIVNYSLSIDDNKEIVRVTGMVNDYKIVAAKEFFARK
jgi:hypothetical protein